MTDLIHSVVANDITVGFDAQTRNESAAGRSLSPQAAAPDLSPGLTGIRSGKVSIRAMIIVGSEPAWLRLEALVPRIVLQAHVFKAKRTDRGYLRDTYSPDFAQWKWGVSPGRTITLPGG